MPSIGPKIVPRGRGWHNTGTTVDDKYYDSTQTDYVGSPSETLEGTVVTYKARKKTTRIKQDTGGDVTMIFVRNVGAAALLPGMAVRWQSTTRGKRVDGMTRLSPGAATAPDVAGFVDDFWPAAGVPIGECFWLIVKGRCYAQMPISEVADITPGTRLVALTAATSGATTAGRLRDQDLSGATAVLGNNLQGKVGTALTTIGSASTNTAFLINVELY